MPDRLSHTYSPTAAKQISEAIPEPPQVIDLPPRVMIDRSRGIRKNMSIGEGLFRKRDTMFPRVTLVDGGSAHFARRPSPIRGAQSSRAFQTNRHVVLLAKGTLFALSGRADRRHGQQMRGLGGICADWVVSFPFHIMPKSLSTCRGKLRGY